ncbi:MAG: PIN domain-containing protein [Deltaproteobacteria bacterium]|nr:PIN domain-containing protein [Deltaproteobacteria bacterium]
MSEGRFFLDTNVLVHAADASSPGKRRRARELIRKAFGARQGCVSTQVMQEYFSVLTRKMGVPAPAARAQVVKIGELPVVQIDADVVLGAIDLHIIHGLSFWDALIVKSAAVAGCRRVYSEDLAHDQVVDGVRIVNPFAGRSGAG